MRREQTYKKLIFCKYVLSIKAQKVVRHIHDANEDFLIQILIHTHKFKTTFIGKFILLNADE